MPRKKKAAQPADSQESRTVTIYAEILQPTDSAVLIRCGESELWLPLSQIPDFNAERGDTNVEIAIRAPAGIFAVKSSRMAGGRKGTVRR